MPVGVHPLANGMPSINTTTTLTELVTALNAVQPPPIPETAGPSAENLAVARCNQAYANALKAAREKGTDIFERRKIARRAFREAMPALSGRQNISDFVACVAQGILIEVFDSSDSTRLLYAAQVANTTSNSLLKPSLKRSKTAT
jgi:hypothetical protein